MKNTQGETVAMRDSEKLLPCPFCGSHEIDPEGVASFKPEHKNKDGLTWDDATSDMIENQPACMNCGASTNGEWNSRAALDSPKAGEAEEALRLALEYWSHRQQRYRNRHPVWVQKAKAALAPSSTKET